MRNLANFALFQLAWFAAVEGASRGWLWLGPAAFALVVAVHLGLVDERRREARYLAGVGLVGAALDSVLHALGATAYPTSDGWSFGWLVPPWIVALWVGFATLPRFSLAWLRGRPWLAAGLGAVGGPLSYWAGARLGAVAVADEPWRTWLPLALEYALVTPLLLASAGGPRAGERP